MTSNSNSVDLAKQSLDQLISRIDLSSSILNLDDLYDAFIRDEVSGNFTHEKRLKVHETYRALDNFMKKIQEI